jgi:hypothetical protein
MAAQLRLVEPSDTAGLVPLAFAVERHIAWPEPSDFGGLLECGNEGCGQVLKFKQGRATCGRCGVAQFVVN